MLIYDKATTLGTSRLMEVDFAQRKPLLELEPERGIEPLTYALRVRCSAD